MVAGLAAGPSASGGCGRVPPPSRALRGPTQGVGLLLALREGRTAAEQACIIYVVHVPKAWQ